MATNVRDPRTIITPDAFRVDPSLLGIPLATPGRRLIALLIDLLVIGVLTALTNSVSLFVWGAVAVFLLAMAFRSPGERRTQMTSMLFRGATGCLGLVILVSVLIGFLVVRTQRSDFSNLAEIPGVDVQGAGGEAPGLAQGLGALVGAGQFRRADDSTEARAALERMLRPLARSTGAMEDVRGAADGIRELAPPDAEWIEDLDIIIDRAVASVEEAAREQAQEAAARDTSQVAAEVAALSDAEALQALATLTRDSIPTSGPEAERVRLLRARLAPLVAADTLNSLRRALDDSEDERREAESDLQSARAELTSDERGFLGLLRDIWNQAGSAIGLWSVYFTVALTLSGGQTVGKKLMGLRVLRLEGEPITWWFAFERAGGYVAGIATGLMGFAQIFWDPNRQCVHDKIGATVVVIDGAEPIPGAWEEAWRQQTEEAKP